MKPTPTARRKPMPRRSAVISRDSRLESGIGAQGDDRANDGRAEHVVTAQETGRPFLMKRRITTTLPLRTWQDQSRPPLTKIAAAGLRGSIFAMRSDGTKNR